MKLRLRRRLLLAFLAVAVPPLALFAAAAASEVSGRFEREARERLAGSLRATVQRIDQLGRRAESQVAAVARDDLPGAATREVDELTLAETLGQGRDLPALEIVDDAGRVVSSRHWPAGIGLPEHDLAFPGDETLRLETVADGYGATQRLALMPSRAGDWRGTRVSVRGGPFLDGDLLDELAALTGNDLAFRDLEHRSWIARPGGPLRAWKDPQIGSAPAQGEVSLGGRRCLWAAAPVRSGRGLWLVAATPRSPVDQALGEMLRLTGTFAGAAILAALVAAALLSARIARPVRELARGAGRVAAGDLHSQVPVSGDDELGALGDAFNRMTAELRVSRERLIQAERVTAWREAARKLAHELKNPLFPIQLSIETLRRAMDEGRDIADLFRGASQTILDELRSLRRIVDAFSDFTRLPRPELAPTDLNAVVEQALALHRARAGTCRIETGLATNLPSVPADAALLGRALGNLVANALEAMPQGGLLSLRTRAAEGEVTAEVEDTGPGLTEEQRARLFTPYFTTKPGGTGLGLVIAQGIVSDHGGRLTVESPPGQGTRFAIHLPLVGPGPVREKLAP